LDVSRLSWATVNFRNLADIADKTVADAIIFAGFIWQASQSYSQSNTEVSVTLVHWLAALDAHPAISALTHPSSIPSYTQQLYAATMNETTSDASAGTNASATLQGRVERLLNNVTLHQSDFIQNGVLNSLEILKHQAQVFQKWHTRFQGDRLDSGFPTDLDADIFPRLQAGTNGSGAAVADKFPKMPWIPAVENANIAGLIKAVFLGNNFDKYRQDSLWSTLLFFAAQFSFMLVPRALTLHFIPKWFAPYITPEGSTPEGSTPKTGLPEEIIKNIQEAAIVGANWDHARPIAGAVIIPAVIHVPGTGAQDTNQPQPKKPTITDSFTNAYYAHYFPEDKHIRGTVLFREPPDWAKQTMYHHCFLDDHTPGGGTAQPKASSNEKVHYEQFSELLAQEAYWDEALKGRRMEVVCPLRFDICPGSTIKVSTGVGRDKRLKNDALTVDYYGFVLNMRLTFDTINASATAQYTLTHARTKEENKYLLKTHPYYNCPPFAHAPWTRDEVKTID
jgi:hypothetical protein